MWGKARSFILIPLVILFIGEMTYADAANPEVLLTTDPKLNSQCAIQSAEAWVTSGIAIGSGSTGNFLYEAAFDRANWSGSLNKKRWTFEARDGFKQSSAVEWDAADILTAAQHIDRRIYTGNISNENSWSAVPFMWTQLSALQKTLLNTSPATGTIDQLGEKRLDYLRGDRTSEIGQADGTFRSRHRLLGDIVNSAPVYLGAPSTAQSGIGYSSFQQAFKNRKHAVFIGANDGMLHAFDANNGNELFAYVPNALFPFLPQLTQASNVHRAYVDGAITIAEARIGPQWKTVLAAGMRGGAQGIFALDVSDAAHFDQGAGALWEFTDADDADMGNVIGAPTIAKFKYRVSKGVVEYRYFVVVPSGVNNHVNDGKGKFNAAAPNVLFLLALDKSKSDKWSAGVNYFKFSIAATDKVLPNGLSETLPIVGDDGAIKHLYAGDLQGNLWRFDFNDVAPWAKALGSGAPKPIFTAVDDGGNRQPITQRPNAAFVPGGYVLLFGTGKLLEANDLDAARFRTQSFYGILDTFNEQSRTAGRSRLARRTLVAKRSDNAAFEIRGNDFKYGIAGKGEQGWYFDFVDSNRSGERSVSTAQMAGTTLFFNTTIPNRDPCKPSAGRSYEIDTLSGRAANADLTGHFAPVMLANPTPLLIPVTSAEVGPRDAAGKRKVTQKIGKLGADAGNTQGGVTPSGAA